MIKIITGFMLLLTCCRNSKTQSKLVADEITGLRVTKNTPVVSQDGKLIPMDDFFNVYYSGQEVMYEFRYKYDSSADGKLLTQGYRNFFFVHHKDSIMGYQYHPYRHDLDNKKMNVDSFLNIRALQNFKWEIVPEKQAPNFTGKDSGDVIKEIYLGPDGYNNLYNDSIIYYYTDALKEFDFSFSKKVDSLKGKKLFKVRLIYPEVYSETYKIAFPKRETYFDMQPLKAINTSEIRKIFQRLPKSSHR